MTLSPVMDHAGRVRRLQAVLGGDTPDQLIVSNLLNVRWLTGFTGSNAQLVLGDQSVTLITDSRYTEQVAEEVSDAVSVVIVGSTKGDRANDHLVRLASAAEVGFEADHTTVASLQSITNAFREAGSPTELKAVDGVIAELRKTKDAGEVAALRQASLIADEALLETVPWLRSGQTETRVARQLEWEMAERGSERTSFSTILASGPNGAKPHARPSGRVLADGDLVVIDFGATVRGYGSDMTRTFVVGGSPTAQQTEWYEAVWAAQRVGVQLAQVGGDLLAVHQNTLEHLETSGQDGVYAHGTGHGVGLFIHENPILSSRVEGTITDSMALTVEPGAYIPGVGGVRVEDLVITTRGGPETLTNFPKGLVHP